jgi:5-methylcytosine-specific restriction endonuclease McrA
VSKPVAWKKESDTAAHHPLITTAQTMVDWPEHLTSNDFANLVWGIISRAATMSAGFTTDYVVTPGALVGIAGDNWRHWADVACKTGLLSPVLTEDGSDAWLLVEDSENLFHIRRKAELAWESRRKKDNASPWLVVPVRLRDGDGCRYCGVVVDWNARRGGRAGTYDHRIPGRGAESPDDLRVSCTACNTRRRDRDDAEQALPPLPAPASPYYGEETAELLAKHGHQVPLSTPKRPRTRRDRASKPSDPAAGRSPRVQPERPASHADHATPATPHPAGPRAPKAAPASSSVRSKANEPRPGSQPVHASDQHKRRSADSAETDPTEVRDPGRVGSGTGAGSGREPPPVPATGRKRRSRRGRPPPPQPPPRKDHRGQGD